MPPNKRLLALLGVAAVIAVVFIWQWVSGWGLITLNYKDAPLSQVMRSIERQGRITLISNADPTTPVTIQVRRAPLMEVLDLLAIRMDGDLRVAYVSGPTGVKVKEGVQAFSTSPNPEGWRVFGAGFGGGGGGGMMISDVPVDARLVAWNLSPSNEMTVHSLLDQGAQKTGVFLAAPGDWNPPVAKLPNSGKVKDVVAGIVKPLKGSYEELFLISVRPPRPQNAERGPGGGEGPPQRMGGGDRPRPNPEWMQERVQAQIALLPPEERAQAQKDYDQMRAAWQEIRALPEDQRREKMQELMSRPDVQDRMEERAASRDERRSPEQRSQRYQRYVERKQQAQKTQTQPR